MNLKHSYAFTFLATLSGVAVGVLASLAMVGPMVHNEVASATKGLSSRSVKLSPVSSETACVSPGGEAATTTAWHAAKAKAPAVVASVAMAPRANSDMGSQGGQWIQKFVGGASSNTTAGIADTGPNSTNTVKTANISKTTVTNNNNVSVSNSSSQNASSGSANVSGNTNAGSAASGQTQNVNETSTDVSIQN